MAGIWRMLRSRILTPGAAAVRLSKRGFHIKDTAAQELLETIGRSFLTGYACAARARSPEEVAEPLGRLPARFRGFAHEGAAMGFAVVDGLSPAGRRAGRRFAGYLAGPGADHIYMAYIGLGWALARLPRFRWPTPRLDPVLRWLVLDGYGFHQAYFRTRRYVGDQFEHTGFPWPAGGWYAPRVIDQGIGRALWFVGGADAGIVADLIEGFPARRRADLYSGAGLAATYAGGAGATELRGFFARAGEFRPQVAQGCAFGAEARRHAGLDVPHTELAAQVFCGMTAAEAADVATKNRPAPAATGPAVPGEVPAHEVWRQCIADQFASLGRC